jgi:TolA-binding protein
VVLRRWSDLIAGIPALRRELKPDDPGVADLDYALGQAQMGLGRMEDARRSFQAVIDARRGGELAAQAQLMRGETYFHEGRLREALREFLQVDILYDAPRWQAAALLEAGKVYERLQQWSDAVETYQRLISRFPNDLAATEARTRREAAGRRASARPARP